MARVAAGNARAVLAGDQPANLVQLRGKESA
jgi:hypothetical protein